MLGIHRAIRTSRLAIILLLLLSPGPETSLAWEQGQQLIVVVTENWNASSGQLRRFSFQNSRWYQVGSADSIVVGRNGLGWGKGRFPIDDKVPGPRKREGDKKGPAGMFSLGGAFGIYARQDVRYIRPSYDMMTSQHRCVDDSNSDYYNQILDSSGVPNQDWSHAEPMRRNDSLYDLGFFVNHNVNPAVAHAGTCIFFHLWKSSVTPTIGCTAMAYSSLSKLLMWIDPIKDPLLVQLPLPAYRFFQDSWRLPNF